MKRLLVVAVLIPSVAHADVAADVARVRSGWIEATQSTGADVAQIEIEQHAVFLFAQSVQSVLLHKPGCGRLVLIGPMGLSFDAQIADAEPSFRTSFAGLVDAGPLCVGAHGTQIRIGAPAGRGSVEVVFGRGATSAADVYAMLGRPRPRAPNLGSAPSPPATQGGGHERFVARHRRAGAVRFDQRVAVGDEPAFRLPLEPGCYLAEVAAQGPRTGARYDLDAEARALGESLPKSDEDDSSADSDDDNTRVLAIDRSSAAQASLEFCVVNPSDVEIRVRGSAGAAQTRLSIAAFSFQLEVPRQLGAAVKAAVERAWRARGGTLAAPSLRHAEFFAAGVVRRRFSRRPGSCHIAFATALDGTPRTLSLGVGNHRDEVRQSDVAASVAFCMGNDGSFDVEVESRGSVPGLGFLLYEVRP